MAKELLYKGAGVVIANGAAISAAFPIPEGHELVGVIMPAAWTAAGLGLSVRTDINDAAFYPVGDAAGEITFVAAATFFIRFDEAKRLLVPAIEGKFRSGTVAAAVNQGAARTLYPVFRQER